MLKRIVIDNAEIIRPDKIYQCPSCDRLFLSEDNLLAHYSQEHAKKTKRTKEEYGWVKETTKRSKTKDWKTKRFKKNPKVKIFKDC